MTESLNNLKSWFFQFSDLPKTLFKFNMFNQILRNFEVPPIAKVSYKKITCNKPAWKQDIEKQNKLCQLGKKEETTCTLTSTKNL